MYSLSVWMLCMYACTCSREIARCMRGLAHTPPCIHTCARARRHTYVHTHRALVAAMRRGAWGRPGGPARRPCRPPIRLRAPACQRLARLSGSDRVAFKLARARSISSHESAPTAPGAVGAAGAVHVGREFTLGPRAGPSGELDGFAMVTNRVTGIPSQVVRIRFNLPAGPT